MTGDDGADEAVILPPREVNIERITRRFLERKLWNCAKILRGNAKADKYKDYVFGLLLLKRCADQFEDERYTVMEGLVSDGMSPEEAEIEAEDYRHYDNRTTIYVPREARWSTINNLTTNIGSRLNIAKNALAEQNPRLRSVLRGSTIDFLAPPGGGDEQIGDDDYKSLIIELRNVSLRDENLEFPDVLGAAYEYMIKHFAESSNDKGGEFYTPREVVRMMVRLLNPRNGDSVYDPTSGSAGMLIHSYQHALLSGNADSIMLYGQEKNGMAWAISEINMVFHSIPSTNYQLSRGDTLRTPRFKQIGGQIQTFDRIIANMPFSMDYNEDLIYYRSRFPHGYPPVSNADWLFIQHMMASLNAGGRIVTVASNAVLFKGSSEGAIRSSIVSSGWVECVISLPEKLFYNTGVPACILILSRPEDRPDERRGRILFINAEQSFHKVRKQNVIGEEHAQKICESFHQFTEIENFSKIVQIENLEGEASLSVRQYIDVTPPTLTQNVTAHIEGGIPLDEIQNNRLFLNKQGIQIESVFNREVID